MVWSEDGTDGRRYSGGLGGSLRLDQEPPEEGDGGRGSRISSGIGLGGIGEGSCQRCKILAFPCDKKKKKETDAEFKVGGGLCNDSDLLCG